VFYFFKLFGSLNSFVSNFREIFSFFAIAFSGALAKSSTVFLPKAFSYMVLFSLIPFTCMRSIVSITEVARASASFIEVSPLNFQFFLIEALPLLLEEMTMLAGKLVLLFLVFDSSPNL